MKNIYEILKSFGLEVPEDKKEEFDKMLLENYKTTAEFKGINDKLEKVTGERDTYKNKYDTDIQQRDTDLKDLQEKLKNAGADAEKLNTLQTQFDTLQTKYDNTKTDYQKALDKQAYEYAIKEKTNALKFTSNSAKKAFLTDALAKNLVMDNGNVLGFDDFVNAYKEQDAGAFIVEDNKDSKPAPKFGSKSGKQDDEPDNKDDELKERPLIW